MKRVMILLVMLSLYVLESRAQTVTDIDGNVYTVLTIGSQEWLKENLKVTHYRNGDPIPNITDNSVWPILSTGAYCNYGNNPGNALTYGKLYNWFAVNDSSGLAPAGWHVATDAEWSALADLLGGDSVAGGKLKEEGTVHWLDPNVGATNEVGFTALPGGLIESYGVFLSIGFTGCWWCSTESSPTEAWFRGIFSDAKHIDRGNYFNKKIGGSVRCVKDAVTGFNDQKFRGDIQIYPNPVIDKLNIRGSDGKEIKVEIYTMSGLLLKSETLKPGFSSIDVRDLPNGLFLIKIYSDNYTTQQKFIKK